MKRKIQYIILTLVLSSCAMKKNYYFTEGETILAYGVMIENVNDVQERFFVTCHQIIDTLNILENLRLANNVGAGLYLYKSYSAVIDFMMEDHAWSTYTLKDGNLSNMILVEVSYTKLYYPHLRSDAFIYQIKTEDKDICICFDGDYHRINYIKSLETN